MTLKKRMELSKTFEPWPLERKWYPFWEQEGFFEATLDPTRPSYCIVLPPPNVTGTLHMGHAFQDTLMDVLIRIGRMRGHNTLWQPGVDHAGIATQIVVERQLERDGLTKHDLGRDAFVEKIWRWKEESGGAIIHQMKRLGSSCDWKRLRFTMDDGFSKAVREVFVRLFNEGLIYRGKKLVNWDPSLQTAVSDLEVSATEEDGALYFIRYPLAEDENRAIVVATTRPETLFGDVAIAVHPEDERFSALIGKNVIVPLVNRLIPIIADDGIDPAFGTGCVKITPAHDFNDYAIGQKHHLAPLVIMTPEARMNDNAPPAYQNLSREEARAKVVKDLQEHGLLAEIKPHAMKVPRNERTGVIVEPMLTEQWFMAMKPLAEAAIAATHRGDLHFVPEQWQNNYLQWLDNIEDWCLSRQLWWGHRIPAWYGPDHAIFVAKSEEEALAFATAHYGKRVVLRQDEDVLDTWFSSALWPFVTLGWPENTRELKLFFPTSVLVTGFDIIFFWVARMVMMSLKLTGEIPFREVYVHGLVRDAKGQKMSKSKGNVLDPTDLIDGIELEALVAKRVTGLMNPKQAEAIAKATRQEFPNGIPAFGADALRFTFASLASTGRDIKFDLSRAEGYRNFCNKLWNAARFVLSRLEGAITPVEDASIMGQWMKAKLDLRIAAIHEHLAQYRFDLYARELHELVWDDFCDWYLECAKVELLLNDQKKATETTLLYTLETILRLMHPVMPFITEELWQALAPLAGIKGASIMTQPYPESQNFAIEKLTQGNMLLELVRAIRSLRMQMGIGPQVKVPLLLVADSRIDALLPYLIALARLQSVEKVIGLPNRQAPVGSVGDMRFMLVVDIDEKAEHSRIESALHKIDQELARLSSKLENENFLSHAPQKIVQKEREKRESLLQERETLMTQLKHLSPSSAAKK